MNFQESASQFAGSLKTLIVTGLSALGVGISQIFSWLPENIGFIASLCGVFAVVVSTVIAIKKWNLEQQKMQLEIDNLKRDRL